ncbi:MAG: GAF domain-containing protein [Saprospiraceae bacterium]
MNIDWTTFPFKLKLHLRSFIEHVRKIGDSDQELISPELFSRIKQAILEHPELMEPIDDVEDFASHQSFLNDLFSTILPLKGTSISLQAVTLPFAAFPAIVATEPYQKLIDPAHGIFTITEISISGDLLDPRILYAYKLILKKFYDLDLKVDHPIIAEVYTLETGLSRYFKLIGQPLFLDVAAEGPLPIFDAQDLQRLLEKKFDEKLWSTILPPELFIFTGFTLITLMDVTTEEAIARLQRNLLRRDFDDPQWFKNIRRDVQNLFRLKGLRLGIATIQRNGALNHVSQNPLWNSLLLKDLPGSEKELLHHSVYEEIIRTGQTIIIEDLNHYQDAHHPLIKGMMNAGYNNLMLVPLYYQDQFIGILELASPLTGEINGLSLFKIGQVKPIFGIALMRLQEEFENKVEAVMMQQFTSIHPTIQWRFRDAAIHLIEKSGNSIVQEEIVFEEVYPFYGSLDIRDSSKKRRKAITQDLLLNLNSAHEVLKKGYDTLSFDILEELIIDIENYRHKVHSSFVSGDEAEVAFFIRDKINPVIAHLEQHYPEMRTCVAEYRGLDKEDTGICIKHRQGYEESVAAINQCIARCLEEEEKDLQRLYPCFFEKYKTDGVEYNIYTGTSIARGRHMDPLYLDNLRLRQLLWTCRMIRAVDQMQNTLMDLMKVDDRLGENGNIEEDHMIKIAPLILAYCTPITLKFRHDEKRLDVDGSYNVRYEMLKKRIDKAVIAGSQERVTQPGFISIIYTRDEEALLYEKHLHYLVKKNLIEAQFEKLELDPLPGVEGLRALRVKVIIESGLH